MRFDKYLTPEERLQAWRNGIAYKLAEKEVLPSEFNKMCKTAQDATGKAIALPLKAMIWSAILSGGALGTLGFFTDEAIDDGGQKNLALRRRRNYFKDVAAKLKAEIENTEDA